MELVLQFCFNLKIILCAYTCTYYLQGYYLFLRSTKKWPIFGGQSTETEKMYLLLGKCFKELIRVAYNRATYDNTGYYFSKSSAKNWPIERLPKMAKFENHI